MFQCISNAVVQKQLIGSNDPGVCEVPKSWRCDRVGRAVIDIRIESVHNGTESIGGISDFQSPKWTNVVRRRFYLP